jgi:hypothetical protein
MKIRNLVAQLRSDLSKNSVHPERLAKREVRNTSNVPVRVKDFTLPPGQTMAIAAEDFEDPSVKKLLETGEIEAREVPAQEDR